MRRMVLVGMIALMSMAVTSAVLAQQQSSPQAPSWTADPGMMQMGGMMGHMGGMMGQMAHMMNTGQMTPEQMKQMSHMMGQMSGMMQRMGPWMMDPGMTHHGMMGPRDDGHDAPRDDATRDDATDDRYHAKADRPAKAISRNAGKNRQEVTVPAEGDRSHAAAHWADH